MEKDSKTKIIAIIALTIAVIGTSIGFAAFSKTFSIVSTNTTTVNAAADPFTTGLYLSVEGQNNGTVSDATGGSNAKGITWSGLTGTITESSKTITYTAKMNNASSYVAYLEEVSSNGLLSCQAINAEDTNAEVLASACDSLQLTVSINGYTGNVTTESGINATTLNDGNYYVDKISGTTKGQADVVLTLTLDSNATLPDGDFTVTIPAITFKYTTLKIS